LFFLKEYPTIKFCNINPFVTNYSVLWANDIYGISNLNENFLNQAPFDNETDPFITQSKYFISIKSGSYLLNLNYAKLNQTEKRKFGYLIDDIMLTCTNKLIPCNKTNDFKYTSDFKDVNCFTYNSGFNMNGEKVEIKESTQTGIESGLSFELLLPKSASESNDLFSTQYGYQISISDQDEDISFLQGILDFEIISIPKLL
jgi:hypothetical protein